MCIWLQCNRQVPVKIQTSLEESRLQIESQIVMSIDRKIIILSSKNFEKKKTNLLFKCANSALAKAL